MERFFASEVWHVLAVVDSQEGVDFAFEYHKIKNYSKIKYLKNIFNEVLPFF